MYKTNNYTPEEIKRMQKRAVERVRNMENRAKKTVENFNQQLPFVEEKTPDIKKKDEKTDNSENVINTHSQSTINTDCPKIHKNCQKNPSQFKINNLAELLIKDEERTLLMLLVLLLISDNENPAIIFALIYILI